MIRFSATDPVPASRTGKSGYLGCPFARRTLLQTTCALSSVNVSMMYSEAPCFTAETAVSKSPNALMIMTEQRVASMNLGSAEIPSFFGTRTSSKTKSGFRSAAIRNPSSTGDAVRTSWLSPESIRSNAQQILGSSSTTKVNTGLIVGVELLGQSSRRTLFRRWRWKKRRSKGRLEAKGGDFLGKASQNAVGTNVAIGMVDHDLCRDPRLIITKTLNQRKNLDAKSTERIHPH